MAGRLIKSALLLALAAGAANLPALPGGAAQAGPGGMAALAAPAGRDENSRELRRELAGLGSTVADLKALARGGGAQAAEVGLSAEERGMMRAAAPQLRFRSNALTRASGLAGGGAGGAASAAAVISRLRAAHAPRFQTFGDFRGDMQRFYYGHQAGAAYALWLLPAAAVVLSFLLLVCRFYTLGTLLSALLFSLCSFLMWAMSASVLVSALAGRSVLAALPRELWLSPVMFLLVSAGLLRLADENYPFWNRAVSALAAPIAAALLAAGLPKGLAALKGLKTSA